MGMENGEIPKPPNDDLADIQKNADYDNLAINAYKKMIEVETIGLYETSDDGLHDQRQADILTKLANSRVEKWLRNIDLIKKTDLSPDDVLELFPSVILEDPPIEELAE